MNPHQIKFTAEYRKDTNQIDNGCSGCLFDKELGSVCMQVEEIAKLRGLPNCDYPSSNGKRVIYVAAEVDERQIELLGEEV
jgi:hypothetical protein